MKEFCTPLPEDRKKYIKDIGSILVDDYGKKDFYKPEEVKKASQKTSRNGGSSGIDYSCWGMSVFSSHEDFDSYHKTLGEICDYAEMKQTMLDGISSAGLNFVFPELSDTEIDLSWLDIGDIFQAVGEFFSSFLD
ncbi:hypothetical protein [Chryseobacterium luteum]|uniref:Uncharacterized protein n=1 Tax=Chryseobacterium luteum TaxID=421531 RepID=A0A085ZD32_9FLAO|nr:hypothetical protein [Chryseobacterium luteum]KFF02346.1 hypothetical protein IX38_14090 [Chryseobacterium luteum]